MASKAFQSLETLLHDTFKKNSAEAKAFEKFFAEGIDENKDPADAAYVRDERNWTSGVHGGWRPVREGVIQTTGNQS